MFSFHKPKIYRSVHGCCICKAKSSSSRFTDSKKYEPEFECCFKINEKRSGEICNACVLLVKRWKKLPSGIIRDWHHVVDARAGPGTKSMMKYKSKSKINKRHSRKSHRSKRLKLDSPEGFSDDVTVCEECLSDQSSSFGTSMPPSLAPSPTPSDASDDSMPAAVVIKPRPFKKQKPQSLLKMSSFLDMTFWKREKVCCGTIFKGPSGEVLIDGRFYSPCGCIKTMAKVKVEQPQQQQPAQQAQPQQQQQQQPQQQPQPQPQQLSISRLTQQEVNEELLSESSSSCCSSSSSSRPRVDPTSVLMNALQSIH